MNQEQWNTFDQLLYFLSHVGELSWEKFKDAINRLTEGDPDANPSTYLTSLARLGHVDFDPVVLDGVVIAPAVLVETAVAGRFVLVGSRTPDFLTRVETYLLESGANLQLVPERYAPMTVMIDKSNQDVLIAIKKIGVHISWAFSAKLVSVLPRPIRTSFESTQSPTSNDRRKFNTDALRYEPVNLVEFGDGLYQIPQHGRDIHILKQGDDLRKVPRDWGEWLALHAIGKTTGLIRYERESWTWCVRHELLVPLLIDRCATLCSGLPPKRTGGFLCYSNVPPGVAFCLTRSLHQKWEVD